MTGARTTLRGLLACVLLSCVCSCSSEERPPAEPSPPMPLPSTASAADPGAPAAAADDVEPTPEELPIREDFEVEAEQQITRENLRAQLDALEQEIASTN